MSFAATWMDLEIIILSEISQAEKDYHMVSLICGIYKTKIIWAFLKNLQNRNGLQTLKTNLWLPKGER